MDIVIIGTGNTASVLGRKLKKAGHNIVQVFGRNTSEASDLAYELDTESTNYWNVVNRNADLYILAVSDIAIEEVFQELQLSDKTIVHTAASVSKHVLKGGTDHYGVLYPLQSLKKDAGYLPEIPMIIDASDKETLGMLDVLAHSISDQVIEADDETRVKLHLAAVMVNNFTNHLYALIEKYCKDEDLDFLLLLPLIRETAARLETIPAAKSQTGPASRGDSTTIDKHLALLQKYPQLKKLYELFTDSILQSR
ncbi:MAG TPA: DUF2520 domain-containing protein [Flavisolibacter sp.]|nr:DUF2520 domain-containing protein [Flavisolibacter sp.]